MMALALGGLGLFRFIQGHAGPVQSAQAAT
jgi:hypothetical protein